MNNEPESLEELSKRVDKLVRHIDMMEEKAARQKEAHELIIHTLSKALHEIEPASIENILTILEHIRGKTKGNPTMFQAIEDALIFFRSLN